MIERRSFEDGVQFVWDGTSVELWQTCPRKYYYRMLYDGQGITAKNKSVHLVFGGIYATALEHFYLYRAQGSSFDEALIRVVREAMIASWSHELEEVSEDEGTGLSRTRSALRRKPGTGHPIAFDHSAKTRPNLIRTIVWYLDQFGQEDENSIRTVHLSDGKPAVELSFILDLTDEFMYAGHLDRLVEFGGGNYWMDQKTTGGTIGPYYFAGFKPSNQFLGYTWAGRTILGKPLRGGIIDAAQIAVNFSRFERAPINFTRAQLDEWHENTVWSIKQARAATLLNNFPMNLSACGNYGGCDYRPICAACPSVRETIIRSEYVHPDKPWDPATPR